MKSLKKKLLCTILCMAMSCSVTLSANLDFEQFYNAGQQALAQYQYSTAIDAFKQALMINYLDNSARIGLINSYLARGTYLANKDKNWEGAANDYRSALFYLKYYPSSQDEQNSAQVISNSMENLNQCFGVLKYDSSPKNRYETAKNLRFQREFAAAGYEFAQASIDPSLKKDCYRQIASIMNVRKNFAKSAEYYQKAIAVDPNDPELRLRHAEILDKLGQNDDAVKEYNLALANGSDDPELLYNLERLYRKKLDQTPNDANALTNLGAILQKENKYDDALKYYMQATQLDPTNVTTKLNVGTLYQQKQQYDAAIGAYDSILFLYPQHVQANLYKAQCLAAMGRKDDALQGFKRVLVNDPSNKQVKAQVFDILKTTMTPAQMIDFMRQNGTLDQGTISDLYDYAIDLHKQKKFDDAIACYKEVLKIKTDSPEIYVNLAIAYKQKGDTTQATQILQNAKTKFPSNKQIADALKSINQEAIAGKFDDASQAFNSGDYQKALATYQSVQPPTFDSLNGIAACYKALNNDAQAIEYYKKALALHQDSDIAYYIGVLYSEKEDWANSKVYVKKALAINPNNTKAKDLLASVVEQANIKVVDNAIDLYDKANYAESLKLLNQVLAEDPKNAYALYYRGLIYDVDKKYTLAITDYKKAIQYKSDLSIIYYLLAIDYDCLSQFKNALMNYKKYVAKTTESNDYKKYAESRISALKKYEGS